MRIVNFAGSETWLISIVVLAILDKILILAAWLDNGCFGSQALDCVVHDRLFS